MRSSKPRDSAPTDRTARSPPNDGSDSSPPRRIGAKPKRLNGGIWRSADRAAQSPKPAQPKSHLPLATLHDRVAAHGLRPPGIDRAETGWAAGRSRLAPPPVPLGVLAASMLSATIVAVAPNGYSGQPTLFRMSNWWARFTIRSRFPLRIAFLVMLMI